MSSPTALVGGFTHTFHRKGKYEWDVGLHYVGDMQPGRMSRAIFDYITQGKVQWQAMPDVYDCYEFPQFTFRARAGKENFKRDLVAQFPDEESAIAQYLIDIKKATGWFQRYTAGKLLANPLKSLRGLLTYPGTKLALMTTQEYLDEHFRDPRLKAALTAQWGDYGLPPSQSAFVMGALLASHYLYGGAFPIGSAGSIAASIVPIIEDAGGQVLVNHTVIEILVDGQHARGVRVSQARGKKTDEKTYTADAVISNAGAALTYLKLVPESVPLPFREEINAFPSSIANVTLYLGLKDDPRSLGFAGENHWMFSSLDHNENYERRNEIMNGRPGFCFLSFPSLKNPEARGHTAEIIAPVDPEPFQKWANLPWKRRGEDYEQLKMRISEALLDFVDGFHPGLRDIVEFCELSTPLTTTSFTGFRGGAIYGIPGTPERFQADWIGARTPIKNLFMTGADVVSLGIVGAMMGGVIAASLVPNGQKNFNNIIADARSYSASLHKETRSDL